MKRIPREAGRVTYSTEIRRLKTIPFNDVQRAVVIGSILGDGCLCENWSKTNYRLFINHSAEQKDYVEWKYNILKKFILSKPRFYDRNNSLTIRTISHQELSELRETFYPNGKKIIPGNIENLLQNPLITAIWFMDDGNAVKRGGKVIGYHINTQSFTKDENRLVAEAFNKLFGIQCSIEKNNGYSRIAIWQKPSRLLFCQMLECHVISSMRYKLFG